MIFNISLIIAIMHKTIHQNFLSLFFASEKLNHVIIEEIINDNQANFADIRKKAKSNAVQHPQIINNLLIGLDSKVFLWLTFLFIK